MSWQFFARNWNDNRELFRSKRAAIETVDEPGQWEIVLLHGWHSLYGPLLPLESALRERVPEARLWRVTYDSHWRTFGRSAREVARLLRRAAVEPSRTVLIGYSMGGLVARALVDNGFDARAVACLSTPHLGPVAWLPGGDIGSISMMPWNARLRRLNASRRERARRGDYLFVGFSFSDDSGLHAHDRVVPLRSALGRGLESVGAHHALHLRYKGRIRGAGPHLEGMNPRRLNVLFSWLAARLDPPQISNSERQDSQNDGDKSAASPDASPEASPQAAARHALERPAQVRYIA